MAQTIRFGTTKFEELPALLQMNPEDLESKKARLFPKGNSEHETSVVSIFLASLSAVKEYREELFLSIGINKIKTRNVNIYIYVEIQDGNKENRPDGLVVITSGKNPIIEWAGIIEAKIGDHILDKNQIDRYADFADNLGIKDIITISNQLVTTPMNSPIKLRRTKFKLYHWSWTYLKVIAQRLIRTDSVEDTDHIYILSELRRFFDDNRSLKNFINMGAEWKNSANDIYCHNEKQKIKSDILDNILIPYIQEEKDNSLQLTDKTSHYIELIAKDDRVEEITQMLQEKKIITSKYMIDRDKHNTFNVEADFKGLSIKCSTSFEISKGKAQAQTTSLLKMLENDSGYPEGIFINAIYPRNKYLSKTGISLSKLIDERNDITNTQYSILDKSLGDTVKYFEIYTINIIGKRFHGNKTFIDDFEAYSERFLNQVMEYIS
ncbi:hypothetical protein [Sulfurimonas sp.]|uniref:hypothetical protein n=1 Tax=Sulfurimonas sp. TaxID=2022749 RepID=UPI00356A584A